MLFHFLTLSKYSFLFVVNPSVIKLSSPAITIYPKWTQRTRPPFRIFKARLRQTTDDPIRHGKGDYAVLFHE